MRKLTLALGAIVALGGLTFFGLAKAQTPPVTFSVYPVPGTLTASAKTQISFRGGDAAAIGTVTVTGSKSGAHAGTLKPHSDGLGASFVPEQAVHGGREGHGRQRRSPVVNATNGDFSFTIGDETRRTLRPVEAPDVGRGTRPVLRHPPGPRPAVGDGHHQQAGHRARASSSSRPRPGAARTAR